MRTIKYSVFKKLLHLATIERGFTNDRCYCIYNASFGYNSIEEILKCFKPGTVYMTVDGLGDILIIE